MTFKYKHIACGGTFDMLHLGHRKFLEFAFWQGAKVSIGVTSDRMAYRSGKSSVSSLSVRTLELKKFLKNKELRLRANILILNDIYGSTIFDKTIEGVVVTKQTLEGGKLINQKREEHGLNALPLITF